MMKQIDFAWIPLSVLAFIFIIIGRTGFAGELQEMPYTGLMEKDFLEQPAPFESESTGELADTPYNEAIAKNIIYESIEDATGNLREIEAAADDFGNAAGSQYDLARDGAFKGYTIAVLHLYTGEKFDFRLPEASLEEKGFTVKRWKNKPPDPETLENELKKACQLWIISDRVRKLNAGHLKVIKAFFAKGKGVYIWGDNRPFYADANYLAKALFGARLRGNMSGDRVLGLQTGNRKKGLIPKHMISTGIQRIYEGITVAIIRDHPQLTPIIYGSNGHLITAAYDKAGKRAIIDGGFTRLFVKWDTAGTGRYVKNAAAWLVNFERFSKKKRKRNKLSRKSKRISKKVSVDGVMVEGARLIAALLAEMGYFLNPLDQVDIREVKTALREYQKDMGLSPTGELDKPTWAELSQIILSDAVKQELKRSPAK
ncbi:MAG: peptidoglycan-binding protein [Gammaproteobacteria bacterium]|nr:peptidoglycan-binding protein [Gammaproteobacteria bacterium]